MNGHGDRNVTASCVSNACPGGLQWFVNVDDIRLKFFQGFEDRKVREEHKALIHTHGIMDGIEPQDRQVIFVGLIRLCSIAGGNHKDLMSALRHGGGELFNGKRRAADHGWIGLSEVGDTHNVSF